MFTGIALLAPKCLLNLEILIFSLYFWFSIFIIYSIIGILNYGARRVLQVVAR